MIGLIERTLRRLDGQLPGAFRSQVTIDISPQQRSGQRPSAACRALSSTAGHRKMCSSQF
jgi:hypothetical protein